MLDRRVTVAAGRVDPFISIRCCRNAEVLAVGFDDDDTDRPATDELTGGKDKTSFMMSSDIPCVLAMLSCMILGMFDEYLVCSMIVMDELYYVLVRYTLCAIPTKLIVRSESAAQVQAT